MAWCCAVCALSARTAGGHARRVRRGDQAGPGAGTTMAGARGLWDARSRCRNLACASRGGTADRTSRVTTHVAVGYYGTDRVGKLGAEAGTRLRAGLLGLAECEADRGSLAVLCVDAGRRAAKAGDEVGAHSWWRRAVAAGSTDPGIVDRLTIWLVKESIYSEAAPALRQALAVPLEAASVRARLEKRLARCERKLGKTPRDGEQP